MRVIFLGCGYLGYNLYTQLEDVFNVEMWGIESPYTPLVKNITYVDAFDPYAISKLDVKDAIIVDTVTYIASTDARTNEEEILAKMKEKYTDLFHALRAGGMKRYIFFSSGGTVYGNSKEAIKEDSILNPQSLYAKSKVLIENLLVEMNLDYLICRVANPYGGYQIAGKKQGVIPIMIRAALEETPFMMYSSLESVRDYFYIDDFACALKLLIEKDINKQVVNIGSGKPTMMRHLIETVEQVTQKKLNIIEEKSDVFVVEHSVLDITKLEELTGYKPCVSLDEGIHRETYRIKEELK